MTGPSPLFATPAEASSGMRTSQSIWRARASLDITVPIGAPVRVAISL